MDPDRSRSHALKSEEPFFGEKASMTMREEKRSKIRLPGCEVAWKGKNCSLTSSVARRSKGLSGGR